jgi:hypothetical protein
VADVVRPVFRAVLAQRRRVAQTRRVVADGVVVDADVARIAGPGRRRVAVDVQVMADGVV